MSDIKQQVLTSTHLRFLLPPKPVPKSCPCPSARPAPSFSTLCSVSLSLPRWCPSEGSLWDPVLGHSQNMSQLCVKRLSLTSWDMFVQPVFCTILCFSACFGQMTANDVAYSPKTITLIMEDLSLLWHGPFCSSPAFWLITIGGQVSRDSCAVLS